MRRSSNEFVENTQGQSSVCVRAKETARKNTTPLTQEEYNSWWPFTRLDPKLFPRRRAKQEDVEDALL